MEDKVIFEAKGKTFVWNEKSIKDMEKLFKVLSNMEEFEKFAEIENIREIIGEQSFPVGRQITLQLMVVDSLFSSLIFNAMFGSSEVDGKPLNVLGCQIECIDYFGKMPFTEQENNVLLMASKIINQKLNPNEQQN